MLMPLDFTVRVMFNTMQRAQAECIRKVLESVSMRRLFFRCWRPYCGRAQDQQFIFANHSLRHIGAAHGLGRASGRSTRSAAKADKAREKARRGLIVAPGKGAAEVAQCC